MYPCNFALLSDLESRKDKSSWARRVVKDHAAKFVTAATFLNY